MGQQASKFELNASRQVLRTKIYVHSIKQTGKDPVSYFCSQGKNACKQSLGMEWKNRILISKAVLIRSKAIGHKCRTMTTCR